MFCHVFYLFHSGQQKINATLKKKKKRLLIPGQQKINATLIFFLLLILLWPHSKMLCCVFYSFHSGPAAKY